MGSPYYSVVSELKIPVDTSDDSKVGVVEAVKFFAKDPPCLDANIEVVKHWIKENQELQQQNLQRDKDLRGQLAELLAVKRKITEPPPTHKPCPICKRPVTSKHLPRHMSIHQPRTAHRCDVCQMEFTRAESLVRHSHIHSDGRVYECARCSHVSGRQDKLCEHL